MIPCSECGVWFFTIQGRLDHKEFCIGYNPEPDKMPVDVGFMTALDMEVIHEQM